MSSEVPTGEGQSASKGSSPDSTCQGDDMTVKLVRDGFKALEEKLAQLAMDNDLKFNKLFGIISKSSNAKIDSELTSSESHPPETSITSNDDLQIAVYKCVEKQDEIIKNMEALDKKVDKLISGERDTYKMAGVIEELVPVVTDATQQMHSLKKKIGELSNKHAGDSSYDNSKMKDVVSAAMKDCKKELKEVRIEAENYAKDLKDIKKQCRSIETYSADNYKRLKAMDRRTKRRHNSDSDSSDDEKGRKRSRSSDSRSESISSKRRSSQGGKRGRSGSQSSLKSLTRGRGQELEKLLVQINDSIGVLSEKIDVQKDKESCTISLLQGDVLPSLNKIKDNVVALPPSASKWDGDLSPSPPRRPASARRGTMTPKSKPKSDQNDGKSSEKKAKKSREKKAKRAKSDSDESSSEDDGKHFGDSAGFSRTLISILKELREQLGDDMKDLEKSWKKNTGKIEETNQKVMTRIVEITMGVQVIAENLDNINDVTKKIDSLDEILQNSEHSNRKLEKAVRDCVDRLDRMEGRLVDLKMLPELGSKMVTIEGLLDGTSGRKITTDECSYISNILVRLEQDNSKKFCEFGGLVETLQGDIVRRLDRFGGDVGYGELDEGTVTIITGIQEAVRNLEQSQAREVLPLLKKILALGGVEALHETKSIIMSDRSTSGASDGQITALTMQLTELQPKLGDLYIKILPVLEDIKHKVRKIEDKDRLTEREDTDHIQRILDIVEDLKEERSNTPHIESRLPHAVMPLQMSSDVEILITAQGEKLDNIARIVNETKHNLLQGDNMLRDAILPELSVVKEASATNKKMLDSLLLNSNSDCTQLSNCNKTLQSLKASLSGANAAIKDVKMFVNGLSDKIERVGADCQSGTSAMINKVVDLQNVVEHSRTSLEKEKDDKVSELHQRQSADQLRGIEKTLKDMSRGLSEMDSKLVGLARSDVLSDAVSEVKTASQTTEKELKQELGDLGRDLKTQLDDVHDMVASVEEKTFKHLEELRSALKEHDLNTGKSQNNIASIMKKSLDLVNQVIKTVQQEEKNITKAMVDLTKSNNNELLTKIDDLLTSNNNNEPSKTGGADTKVDAGDTLARDVLAALESLKSDPAKLDQLLEKVHCVGLLTGQIKFLLEKRSGITGDESVHKVSKKSLEGFLDDDASDAVPKDMSRQLSELKASLEEDLNTQSELMTDVSNSIQELSDKMVSREAFKLHGDEMRKRLADVCQGITEMGGHGGGGGGGNHDLADLQDRLIDAISEALREDNRKQFEFVLQNLDDLDGKLHSIKKSVLRSEVDKDDVRKGELIVSKLDSVIRQVSEMHVRSLSYGDAASSASTSGQPNLDAQPLLKAVNNVEHKLTNEFKRLWVAITEYKQPGGSRPSPSLQLLDLLDKILSAQQEIKCKQDLGVSAQKEANSLLQSTVETLEQVSNLVESGGNQMTGRFADLCDDLTTALGNLLKLRDKYASTISDNLLQVDHLVKRANSDIKQKMSNKRRLSEQNGGPSNSRQRSGGRAEKNTKKSMVVNSREEPEMKYSKLSVSKVTLAKEPKQEPEDDNDNGMPERALTEQAAAADKTEAESQHCDNTNQ